MRVSDAKNVWCPQVPVAGTRRTDNPSFSGAECITVKCGAWRFNHPDHQDDVKQENRHGHCGLAGPEWEG